MSIPIVEHRSKYYFFRILKANSRRESLDPQTRVASAAQRLRSGRQPGSYFFGHLSHRWPETAFWEVRPTPLWIAECYRQCCLTDGAPAQSMGIPGRGQSPVTFKAVIFSTVPVDSTPTDSWLAICRHLKLLWPKCLEDSVFYSVCSPHPLGRRTASNDFLGL